MISDEAYIRYQRQIQLVEIGLQGQQSLEQCSVLVVGCGGLGSAAIPLLAGAGVGKLVIADHDTIDVSNLHRQTHYQQTQLGQSKVKLTRAYVEALNSQCQVRVVEAKLSGEQLTLECMLADIVLDCSDNMTTRHALNQACYQSKTKLVSAAAIGWKGQLAVYDYGQSSPCYHCLFPFERLATPTRCSEHGVMGPVVAMMGSVQALEALKHLTLEAKQTRANQLHLFDGLINQWQSLVITKDATCKVCQQATTESEAIQ